MIRPKCQPGEPGHGQDSGPYCSACNGECDQAFELIVKVRMALKEHAVPACPLSRALIALFTNNDTGVEYEEI